MAATDLIEPASQASLRRLSFAGPHAESRLLFSNPASEELERMCLRISADEGHSWSEGRVLAEGPAACSDLAILPEGEIACLFEAGSERPDERITLVRLDPKWLDPEWPDPEWPDPELLGGQAAGGRSSSPREYMGRTIARTMHWRAGPWLLRAEREEEERTELLLEALDIEEGWTVCDLGCGNGFLSLPLAERVGERGRVLAVDIQPPMLASLEARAAEAGLTNIRAIRGWSDDPRLLEGSCDLVLMVDVYHELSRPDRVLSHIRSALSEAGRLVLVEFRAEDPEVPIKAEHKMSRAQILLELEANGFRSVAEFDGLPRQHVISFERSETAVETPAREP